MNKELSKIINDIAKSQVNAKNILETFAYENKIDLKIDNKLLSEFIKDLKKEDPNIDIFNSILDKLK